MRKEFTAQEIELLQANPNTFQVTKFQLQLTIAAKERIIALVKEGRTNANILRELGYDVEMLGATRVDGIVRHARDAARSPQGIREGHHRPEVRRMTPEEIDQLPPSNESFKKLKNEVAYLRQEVEFLKKLSALANTKKRGD